MMEQQVPVASEQDWIRGQRPKLGHAIAAAATPAAVDISIIVPLIERSAQLDVLCREYLEALSQTGRTVELLVVAPASSRAQLAPLVPLVLAGAPIRLIEEPGVASEAALLRAGLSEAGGEIIFTLPAYRQVEATVLPELLQRLDAGADLVTVCRWPRRDAWVNRLQSRTFHAMVGGLANGKLHDIACGVRAMRREALATLPLYGDLARFLPVMAVHHGFDVAEVTAPQHREDMSARLYRPGVYLRRLLDVLGLFFVLRFTEKPLRFFGLLGSVCSLSGAVMLFGLLMIRMTGQGIGRRPSLLLATLIFVLGVQMIALGLIGELIVHYNRPGRRLYRVRSTPTRRRE